MPYAQGMRQAIYILPAGATTKTLPTAGSVTADKVPVVGPNFKPTRNKFKSAALTGTPEPRAVVPGKMGADWDVRAECNPSSMDPWLTKLFGTRENNGTTALYSKRYYLGTIPEFAFEDAHTDLNKFFRYLGAYCGSGSFTFNAEGAMEATFAGKALKVLASASATAIDSTIADRTPFAPFSYLYGHVKRNGTVLGTVKVATLEINRALGWDSSQDETNEMAVAFSEVATVTGTITAHFTDPQFYDDAINNNQTALELFVPYGSGQAFKVILPACYLEPFVVTTNGTGLITLVGGFEAQGIGTTKGAVYSSFLTAPSVSSLTLIVKVDAGAPVTVTFTAGDNTPDAIAARINGTGGLTSVARVERMAGETGGVVILETATSGSGGAIQVTGGTAAATLGYDLNPHAGLSNVHGEYWLFNKVA